jgi:hypothetical protein
MAKSPEDSVRPDVTSLAGYAPLGTESGDSEATEEVLQSVDDLLDAIAPPLTLSEARALLPLLNRESADDLYGLIWSLVSLLETAPGWPPAQLYSLVSPERPWFQILIDRVRRADELADDGKP